VLARRVHVIHVVQERVEARIDTLTFPAKTDDDKKFLVSNEKAQKHSASQHTRTHRHVVRTRVVRPSLEAVLPPWVAPRVSDMRRGVCRRKEVKSGESVTIRAVSREED
jgi:hypothetical protein